MLTRHHPLSGRLARASALLLLLLALALPAFGAPNEILLAAGSLDTRQPVAPPADPSLRIAPPDPDESAHWIVHWNTDVSTARKDELRGLGAELLGYLPERAWLVRMTGAQALIISKTPRVFTAMTRSQSALVICVSGVISIAPDNAALLTTMSSCP